MNQPDKYTDDPQLSMSFTPGDVRTHFDGSGQDDLLADLSDESLAIAAREVIWKDEGFYEAACQVFDTIIARAIQNESARRN